MARITLKVKLVNRFDYQKSFGWQTQYMSIYKMVDENGKIYVWNTGSTLAKKVPGNGKGHFIDAKGDWDYEHAEKGDTIIIKASVKGESEYKGEQQTELTRCEIVEFVEKAEDLKAKKAAEKEERKQKQLESITGEDFIWKMPYKQYKEHYADCETVIDSYEDHVDKYGFVTAPPTIKVIIREGRLKANGTRGKHYAGHRIQFDLDGHTYIQPFRAVSEATAIRQAKKEHPTATNFACVEIIHYTHRSDWY